MCDDDLRSAATCRDRRREPRQRLSRGVKLFDPLSGRFFPGRTLDCSPGGLCVRVGLATPVFPGRTVAVHLGREGHQGAMIERRFMQPASVVWVRRDPGVSREAVCGLRLLPDAAGDEVGRVSVPEAARSRPAA